MPTTYAHYRMGQQMLPRLEPEVRSCIRRNHHLYDLGLHGPDFLFFYAPFRKDRLYRLSSSIHKAPGREFFLPAIRQLRLSHNEGALAYLYGVLAHFALDSRCHPFINRKAAEGIAGHSEMETEFDRYLLELDGKPYTTRTTDHLHIDHNGEAQQIARFYPRLTAPKVKASFRNYRFLTNFCTAPPGLRRKLIGAGVFSNLANEFMMTPTANLRCETLTPEIYARYLQAEEDFPSLMAQFRACLNHGTPLGADFDRDFG